MAENNAHGKPKRGRTKLWTERLHLTLAAGAKDRIDAVLRDKEDRLAFIRSAIDSELRKRERGKG